jgi:hypothetical protein
MKKIALLCLFPFLSFGQMAVECFHDSPSTDEDPDPPLACWAQSKDFQNHPLKFHSTPFKTVNIYLHIVRDENGQNNFQDTPGD